MTEPATIQILSAAWERDHEDPSVRQQHGALIWNQNSSGWGFRGRSNPFPRLSWLDPNSYSNSLLQGYREGFYQMCSTINRYNLKPTPVKFFATKGNLGNSCWGHPKVLTIDYLCVKNGNSKQHKTATAKENE